MSEESQEQPPIDPQESQDTGEGDLYHEFEFVSEEKLEHRARVENTPEAMDADHAAEELAPAEGVFDTEGDDLYGAAIPMAEELLDVDAAAPSPFAEEVPVRQPVNRPAEGARQVLPGEVLSQGFQGSENAGDFLGLDLEFTEADHELELAQAPQTGLPAEDLADPAMPASELMAPVDDETLSAEGDEVVFDDELDPSLEEAFAEEEAEEEELQPRRGMQLLLASAVGALIVTGVTLIPRYLGKGTDTPAGTMVATNTPKDGPGTVPAPVPTSGANAGTETLSEGTPGTMEGPEGAVAAGNSTQPVHSSPASGTEPVDPTPSTDPLDTGVEVAALPDGGVAIEPNPVETPSDPLEILTGVETTPIPTGVGADTGIGSAAGVGVVASEGFPNFDQGFEWVRPESLDMVWRGEDIPMEAIDAPAKTLMPHVGTVRVHMRSGDSIEGRLYAVGESRVWIDMAPGRVGLDGREVVRFERLTGPSTAGVGFASGAVPVGGPRVRVRAPGGTFYGKVVSQEGSTVTLLQEGGGRIVLHQAVVEAAATSRAIVVQR